MLIRQADLSIAVMDSQVLKFGIGNDKGSTHQEGTHSLL
jgi:hypothetical protein